MEDQAPQLLLLVDMQKGFMNEATQPVVPAVQRLVKIWQERDWPIACSRFINLQGSNWERLRDWHELQGEPETSLIPELENVTRYVFKKSTYSAWSPEILSVAEIHRAHDVVIAGVDTNECVLATALGVFDTGFTPWVVQDACASTGGNKPHDMAVELLGALLGERQVITIDNMQYAYDKAD